MQAPAADITNLQRFAISELPLNTKIPRLCIGLLQMRINTIEPWPSDKREIRNRFAGNEGLRTEGICRPGTGAIVRNRQTSGSKAAGRASADGIACKGLVVDRGIVGGLVPQVLLWLGELTQ